jgi:hypothetical protein
MDPTWNKMERPPFVTRRSAQSGRQLSSHVIDILPLCCHSRREQIVKIDATLILVETDKGLTGMGAALGTPPIVSAIVEHELASEAI